MRRGEGGDNRCPVCSSAGELPPVETVERYRVLRCAGCGLGFSSPMTPGDDRYYAGHFSPESYWRWDFTHFLQHRPKPGGRLLELGCHTGHFLSRARAKGYRVAGLDINPRALDFAQTHYGLGDLREADFHRLDRVKVGEPFDVVVAFQVVEHMADPVEFLRQLSRFLAPGGVLIVTTPNAERWTLRFGRESWDYPPHHLTRWTEASLSRALEAAGWKVDRIDTQATDDLATARGYVESAYLRATGRGVLRRMAARSVESQGSSAGPSAKRRLGILRAFRNVTTRGFVTVAAPLAWPVVRLKRLAGENLYAVARYITKSKG